MTNKGKKYITNGIIQTLIYEDEPMPNGFHFGKLPITDETRKILSDSHKGKKLSKESIDKRQKTFRDKYGVSSCSQLPGVSKKISDKLSSEEVQNKMKATNLERYGVESVLANEEIQAKMRNTNLERHGSANYNNKDKEYTTKKNNGTLGNYQSAPEKEIGKLLIDEFGDNDVEFQYKTKDYPFMSDFYIKSKNVYIEYHGSWQHNTHPFNNDNKDDLLILENWKSKGYNNAIYTWTDLDVRKRSYQDKINLIIFYPDKQDDIVSSFMKIKAELDSY